MKKFGKIGDFFRRLLKSIEEQNKESFGEEKLDCCDLNKKKDSNKSKDKD